MCVCVYSFSALTLLADPWEKPLTKWSQTILINLCPIIGAKPRGVSKWKPFVSKRILVIPHAGISMIRLKEFIYVWPLYYTLVLKQIITTQPALKNYIFMNRPIILDSFTLDTWAAFVENAENTRHRGRFVKVNILIGLVVWEDFNGRHTMAAFHRWLRWCVWQQGREWWWWCQRSRGMRSEWYCVTPSGSKSCWASIHS